MEKRRIRNKHINESISIRIFRPIVSDTPDYIAYLLNAQTHFATKIARNNKKSNSRNFRTPFEERVAKKKRMIRKIDQNVILLQEIDPLNATALNPQSKFNERTNE